MGCGTNWSYSGDTLAPSGSSKQYTCMIDLAEVGGLNHSHAKAASCPVSASACVSLQISSFTEKPPHKDARNYAVFEVVKHNVHMNTKIYLNIHIVRYKRQCHNSSWIIVYTSVNARGCTAVWLRGRLL